MPQQGTLLLFCGKMGAGKSTTAKKVAIDRNAILIAEDEWLATLYPEQIKSFDDYIKFSGQLKPLIKAHVNNILKTGTQVVMDFPANTKRQRAWFNQLALAAEAKIELIYLKENDALCLKQIAQRSIEQPARVAFDTEQMFYQVSKYFEEPDESENIQCKVIERNA